MTDLLLTSDSPNGPVSGDAHGSITDAELTAQALATPVMAEPGVDAVNYWDVVAPRSLGLLPEWYMPSSSAGARRLTGWRRQVVLLVIVAIGLINAAGLCITYGYVTLG